MLRNFLDDATDLKNSLVYLAFTVAEIPVALLGVLVSPREE